MENMETQCDTDKDRIEYILNKTGKCFSNVSVKKEKKDEY